MNAYDEFRKLLDDELESAGRDLEETSDAFAQYLSERADHLALASAEPGFAYAVNAEAKAAAIRAGINVSETASSWDSRMLGLLAGALRIAAIALV